MGHGWYIKDGALFFSYLMGFVHTTNLKGEEQLMMNRKRLIYIIMIFFFVFTHPVLYAFAHASLTESSPVANSHLTTSPKEVTLHFNEAIQNKLFSVKVMNEHGKNVVHHQVELNEQHDTLHLKLPKLSDGIYIVRYHIISADGHPVENSFPFAIGHVTKHQNEVINNGTPQPHHMSLLEWLFHMFYYLGLLIVVGFLFWSLILNLERAMISLWINKAFSFFLIFNIMNAIITVIKVMSDSSIQEVFSWFESLTGILIFLSMTLTLIGVFIKIKNKGLTSGLILFLLICESVNGHAMSVQHPFATVFLDFIHLLMASIWAGGLVLIFLLIRNDKTVLNMVLPRLSRGFVYSMLIALLSGLIMTWQFSPNLLKLTQTTWGILLIIKVFIVIFVFAIGYTIRRQLKKKSFAVYSKWFKVDVAMMVVIVFLVAGMTHLSYLPTNDPISWVDEAHGLRVTTKIMPNNPGMTNTISVYLDVMNRLKPKEVTIHFKNEDHSQAFPMEVTLKKAGEQSVTTNDQEHVTAFNYQGEVFMPSSGHWKAIIYIYDKHHKLLQTFTHHYKLYAVKTSGTILAGQTTKTKILKHDIVATVSITPNRAGKNTFHIEMNKASGKPADTIAQVTLSFTNVELNQTTKPIIIKQQSPGVYNTSGFYFYKAGLWDVHVHVLTKSLEDLDAHYPFVVGTN